MKERKKKNLIVQLLKGSASIHHKIFPMQEKNANNMYNMFQNE